MRKSVVITKVKLRADLQLLRFLAVMVVIIHSLWPKLLTGGFIGVDILFVISGALITSYLLKEISGTSKINFAVFYAKRIKKLLPPMIVVTISTIVLSIIFIPLSQISQILQEAFASIASIENFIIAGNQLSSLKEGNETTPFHHFWAVSVNEQLNFAWSFLLLSLLYLGYKTATKMKKTSAYSIFIFYAMMLFLVCFTFSIILVINDPAHAYFSTLSRAWEFLLGCAVSLLAPFTHRSVMSQRRVLRIPIFKIFRTSIPQLFGYALIIFSVVEFNGKTPLPGALALIPTLGTALIVAYGRPLGPRFIQAVIESPFVQFCGNSAFSLYLWHWPFIVIWPYIVKSPLQLHDQVLILILTVSLGMLTTLFVQSNRYKLLAIKPKPIFTGFLVIVHTFALIAFLPRPIIEEYAKDYNEHVVESVRNGNIGSCMGVNALLDYEKCGDSEMFAKPAPLDIAFDGYHVHPTEHCSVKPNDYGASLMLSCDYSEGKPNAPRVVLYGDTHAEMMQHSFHDIAKKNKWKLDVRSFEDCMPIDFPESGVASGCTLWSGEQEKTIAKDRPNLVIMMASHFAQNRTKESVSIPDHRVSSRFTELTNDWTKNGTKVLVIHDVPLAGDRLSDSCILLSGNNPKRCTAPVDKVFPPDRLYNAANSQKTDNVSTLDIHDLLCDSTTCFSAAGHLPIYSDYHRLSGTYMKTITPHIEKRLDRLISDLNR